MVKSQLLGVCRCMCVYVCSSLFPLHMVLTHPAAHYTDETLW